MQTHLFKVYVCVLFFIIINLNSNIALTLYINHKAQVSFVANCVYYTYIRVYVCVCVLSVCVCGLYVQITNNNKIVLDTL